MTAMNLKKDFTRMSETLEVVKPPVVIHLEDYFSNSIIPQLFVDSDMLLRDYTPPIEKCFSICEEDIGRSIYELKEKIGHRGLSGNIKGVIYTERNLEKTIRTETGNSFRMNIQPSFTEREEMVNGVIITFSEL